MIMGDLLRNLNTFSIGLAYGIMAVSVAILWLTHTCRVWSGVVEGPFTIEHHGREVELAKSSQRVFIQVERRDGSDVFILMVTILSLFWPLTAAFVIVRWLLSLPVRLYQKAAKS